MQWWLPSRVRWQVIAMLVAAVLLAVVGRSLWAPSQPPHQTVGSYFDSPPAWPGPPWQRNGVEVSRAVLETAAGPEHCGWQSVTFMTMGWPAPTEATSALQARQYLRDRNGVLMPGLLKGTWALNPTLPSDATDSGFRYGQLKLFFASSDEATYVYVVAPADSERWPRSDPMTTCS